MSASATKRLLDFYRNLPGELRTFALLLGVLVPTMTVAGLFWFLNSGLGLSKVETVLALLGLLVLITVVVLGVNFIARWRENRRASKLGREMLEAPASRQTSVSEREAIRQNNAKFVAAVADMKKTWGISAYSLPWYIVIGESGCGKTRLINESNLEFPSGKPEGHNVGTLNYNWWFTQDMVFLDMAGRLVNPAEEKDHQEWLGFLRSVRKARPACPINGALVCMSADEDLLGASPEKLRANAENMLVRLRELQRELGVTFPVYLVVTKCDKLLGFMEFFGRVTGKLALSTQMVGWSRPGEDFSAAFDPDTFRAHFNELYERLHEFRLRRLRDDIDESARAAAYCFPEELAQLREPLLAYVSTLFPLLKNQLVLKNLVFRGVYFTSATQQGGAVLGHLRNRLGEDAARALERLAPLFTQPEPRFVKDLLQKKVEPEHGLVYRNEGQLKRNRAAARWLNIATAALVVLGGLGWWWSYSAFKKVVQQPREDAKASHQPMVASADFAPATALARTAALGRDAEHMRQHGLWLARVLSLGTQTEKPLTWLGEIRAGIIRDKLLPVAAERIIAGVHSYPLDDPSRQGPYLDAIASLLAWRRSAGASCMTDCVTAEGLRQMAAIAPAPGSDSGPTAASLWDWKVTPAGEAAASQPAGGAEAADVASFSNELQLHFAALEASRHTAPNPARAFGGEDVTAAIRAGVKRLAEQRMRWAKLEPAPPGTVGTDPEFDAILALARDCAAADHAYNAFLTAASPRQAPGTAAEFEALAQAVQKNANDFAAALDRCARSEAPRVELLWEKLRAYRNRHWYDAHQKLINVTCTACDGTGARLSQPATPRDLAELDLALWNTLVDMRLAEGTMPESGFDSATAPQQFRPLADAFAHIVTVQREPVPGNVQLTDVAREMQRAVQQIAAELAPGAGNVRTLTDWANRFRSHRAAAGDATALSDALRKTPAWQPDRLIRVREDLTPLVHRARGGALLATLSGLLDRIEQSDPLAMAAWQTPRWREPVALAYALPTPPPIDDLFPSSAPAPVAPTGDAPVVSIGDRAPAGGGARTQSGPYALTRAGLMETAIAAAMLQNALTALQPTDYLATDGGATPDALASRVGRLWERYSEAYVTAWAKAIQARPVADAPQAVWDTIVRLADGRAAERWAVETADFVENVACSGVYVDRDGAWLDNVRVHSSTAETRALDAALQQAMRRAFPNLQRPALGREGGLPWEREATAAANAWRDLRSDVQTADATLSGRTPARPDASRFARFAEAESTFTWPDLPALQDARNFERAACTALGLELKRKLESTGGALASLSLEQRCARWRELKDELNAYRSLLGGCGRDALTWSPPDLEACCQPSVSADISRLELTFELMTDGELAQTPNVRPGDNTVASCFRKVRLLVGASEAVLDTATGGDRRKVIALTQANGFTLSFETPVGQEQVEPVAPRNENFGSWGEFIAYLQKGQQAGDGVFITVHPFETRSKSGGKIQTFKQAIRWTVRGKIANMSVTDYLQRCGS